MKVKTVRLDAETDAQLNDLAKKTGLTEAYILRRGVVLALRDLTPLLKSIATEERA